MALRRAGVGIRAERNVERILYADDAGIVSKSTERRAKTMKVIVTVLEAGRQAGRPHDVGPEDGHHAAANKGPCIPGSTVFHRSNREQSYKQTNQRLHLGGVIREEADLMG